MLCARCLTDNPDGNRFCDSCGAGLDPTCAACGYKNRNGAKFCASCGRDLAAAAPAEQNQASVAVPLMPPKLAAQVLNSRFAREGQRKLVTVLFADIRGSTELIHSLDPEQALQQLDPVLKAMSGAVHRFGGTVNRVQGDGIMALFGAPHALEDHAAQACFAARAMLDVVTKDLPNAIEIRVGLHSGEVIVRSVGNDMSMEYDAVGLTAHLANRLEQIAAPGAAVLTAETARLADGFVVTRQLGSVAIKGVNAPMELFELVGTVGRNRWEARAATHTLTRFVGRELELHALVRGLQRARNGQGAVIEIVGEAGMGKSRLIHELISHPSSGGCTFVCAAAMPYDQDTPHFFVSNLVRSLINASASDSLSDIDQKLVAATDPLLHDGQFRTLTALRSLLDLPLSDVEWERTSAAQRRQHMEEAVRLLLVQIAQSTVVVLVLEDLHWVDSESLTILKSIIESSSASRVLIVATSRPEFVHGWPRYSYRSLLRLLPLESSDADTILRDILDDGQELSGLRQRLVAHGGGAPLFLEEMARALIEAGAVRRDGTGLRLTRGDQQIEVPSTLQAVIASRIDRLTVESRTVLQIASVIGKDVPFAPLRAVAELPDDHLFAQLTALQSLEFLHDISRPPHIEYTFKHALTHSITYEGMLQKHRRALHERVMSAIELLYADRLDEFTERLAWHAARAENHAKSVEYNYRAGVRANARSAYREAVVFLERALDALSLLPDTAVNANRGIDIRLNLRVALLAGGDLVQAHTHLEQAEALAVALDDRRRLMPIINSRATILVNLGALDQAIETGLRGHALAEQSDDRGCYVSACYALGQAYWNQGDFGSAEAALSRGIDLLEYMPQGQFTGTTGSVPVLCYVSLSHTYAFMGEMKQACLMAQKALEIAHDTARPYDLSYAHTAQGLVDLLLGNLHEAIRQLEQALDFNKIADIKLLVPHTARYLGRAYALAGRLDEARTLLKHAVDYTAQRSLVGLQGWCAASLGLTHLLSGELAAARLAAGAAFDLARRHGYVPLRAHAVRLIGTIAAREDSKSSHREAENWLRNGASVAATIGMQPEVAHCHYELAGVLARARRLAEARTALTIAARTFHSAGISVYESLAEQALATLPESDGRRSGRKNSPREGHDKIGST